jgi:type IV fimbrial biogenesis protein FimT
MKSRKQIGFTLPELMVTLLVAAIVLGFGAPSFSQFLANSRMTSSANDIIAAIQAARSEAVKRHQPVVMCFSAAPQAAPACDGSGTDGWIVFVDSDNDVTVDSGEQILLAHASLPTELSVKQFKPSGTKKYLSYASTGFSVKVASFGEPVTSLVLCDKRGNATVGGTGVSAARGIQITPTGRPSVTNSVTIISSPLGGCV